MSQLVFPFKVSNSKTYILPQPTQRQLFDKIQLESNKQQTKLNQLQSTHTTMLYKFNQIQTRDTTMLTKLNQIQAFINTPQLSIVYVDPFNNPPIDLSYFRLLFSPELYNTILNQGINAFRVINQPSGMTTYASNMFENGGNPEPQLNCGDYVPLHYETILSVSGYYAGEINITFEFSKGSIQGNSGTTNPGNFVLDFTLPQTYTIVYNPYNL